MKLTTALCCILFALLLPAIGNAAVIYEDATGEIARYEQNVINRASIKLPDGLVARITRETPASITKDTCGKSWVSESLIYVRRANKRDCTDETIHHEMFHVLTWKMRYTPWFGHLQAAYRKIRVRTKERAWMTPEEAALPYAQQPSELIANDYETCASIKRRDWDDYVATTLDWRRMRVCRMLDRYMQRIKKAPIPNPDA